MNDYKLILNYDSSQLNDSESLFIIPSAFAGDLFYAFQELEKIGSDVIVGQNPVYESVSPGQLTFDFLYSYSMNDFSNFLDKYKNPVVFKTQDGNNLIAVNNEERIKNLSEYAREISLLFKLKTIDKAMYQEQLAFCEIKFSSNLQRVKIQPELIKAGNETRIGSAYTSPDIIGLIFYQVLEILKNRYPYRYCSKCQSLYFVGKRRSSRLCPACPPESETNKMLAYYQFKSRLSKKINLSEKAKEDKLAAYEVKHNIPLLDKNNNIRKGE